MQLIVLERMDFEPVPLFLQKLFQMENNKKYTGIWWLVFLSSTALLGYAIYDHWEYLTLIMPFVCTSFVKALDII